MRATHAHGFLPSKVCLLYGTNDGIGRPALSDESGKRRRKGRVKIGVGCDHI